MESVAGTDAPRRRGEHRARPVRGAERAPALPRAARPPHEGTPQPRSDSIHYFEHPRRTLLHPFLRSSLLSQPPPRLEERSRGSFSSVFHERARDVEGRGHATPSRSFLADLLSFFPTVDQSRWFFGDRISMLSEVSLTCWRFQAVSSLRDRTCEDFTDAFLEFADLMEVSGCWDLPLEMETSGME